MIRSGLGLFVALLLGVLVAGVVHAALGDHISEQDFDLDANTVSDGSAGIAWDGSRYIVAVDTFSQSGDDVYIYNSSGTRVPGQGFHLPPTNTDAVGVTWDGTHIRVVDRADNKVYTYSSSGTQVPTQDFNLNSSNQHARGIAWDGSHFWVVDDTDDKIYSYDSSGTHVPAQDFALTAGHDHPGGIAWDGSYLRLTDSTDDKIYSYNSSGTHVPAQDFALAATNDNSQKITWDGVYIRVLDYSDDKVYTYEGLPVGPFTNHGLSGDVAYAAAFASATASYDGWSCLQSTGGETYRANNAQITVHGFCAQVSDSGMTVEVHLSPASTYSDLSRFSKVTGRWWLIKAGAPAVLDQRIYDDAPTDTGELAFTEEVGGLGESSRLGFTTLAKSVTDDDCAEASDGTGFACTLADFQSLLPANSDEAVLVFGLTNDNNIEFADGPRTPESPTVSRSADYTTATIEWVLYDAVTEYEIERSTAVQVNVADASRIEYGDPITFVVSGTQAGIDEYEDNTIQAHRTYQYRVRARGAEDASWSAWTSYVFSGAEPSVDLPAPGNLELVRSSDSVIASWSAPAGELDNYTLQRQELLATQGSTFFGNVVTLGDGTWLPGDSTMYTDDGIVPDLIYEYRVAAVRDDQVGEYTDWFRIGPVDTSLGVAPDNFRLVETGERVLDERYEFWLEWDENVSADDYEVQLVSFDQGLSGGQDITTHIVTDPTFFQTAFGRVALRVRARKQDDTMCATAADDTCLTDWTAWHDVRFTPKFTIDAPEPVDASSDADLMEFRDAMQSVVETALSPLGADVNPMQVFEFGVLAAALGIGGASVVLSWRAGMAPLGVGMGSAALVLVLFAGWRLLGTNLGWAVAAQTLVAVPGMIAIARQFGVWSAPLLLKLLIALVMIHLALGFTQMAVTYYAAESSPDDVVGYNWVANTPIGDFLPDTTPQTEENQSGLVRGAFEFLNRIGDSINGLATFGGYGFITDIEPDQGLIYVLVMILRLISVLVWLGLAWGTAYFLFDSNLLTSKIGLSLLALGGGIGGLSALGAIVGD